jgi:hypothetical protein
MNIFVFWSRLLYGSHAYRLTPHAAARPLPCSSSIDTNVSLTQETTISYPPPGDQPNEKSEIMQKINPKEEYPQAKIVRLRSAPFEVVQAIDPSPAR